MQTLQRYAWIAIVVLATAGCASQDDAVVDAWNAYHRATSAADVPGTRALMAAGVGLELEGPGGEAALALRSALVPAHPVVTGVDVSKTTATVSVSGTTEGQNVTGTIAFVKESGAWKVQKEDWNVDMTVAASYPTPDVNLAGEYAAGRDAQPHRSAEIAAHEGAVRELAFTRDGQSIVSIGYDDYHLRLWSAATGELLDDIKCDDRPHDLALRPDGTAAYVVDTAGRITEWPIEWNEFGEPIPFAGLAGRAPRIAVDAVGHWAVTTSWDDPAKLWDLDKREFVRSLPNSEKMRGVAFSPTAARVACGSHEDYFAVWNLDRLSWPLGAVKKHRIDKATPQSDVHNVAYSADGHWLATGHMDASLTIWDMDKGRALHNWYVQDCSAMDVTFSPCGTVLATAQSDGKVHLWETATQRNFVFLRAHEGAATAVAFNPADGVSLATGGEDGMIRIWR